MKSGMCVKTVFTRSREPSRKTERDDARYWRFVLWLSYLLQPISKWQCDCQVISTAFPAPSAQHCSPSGDVLSCFDNNLPLLITSLRFYIGAMRNSFLLPYWAAKANFCSSNYRFFSFFSSLTRQIQHQLDGKGNVPIHCKASRWSDQLSSILYGVGIGFYMASATYMWLHALIAIPMAHTHAQHKIALPKSKLLRLSQSKRTLEQTQSKR